MGAVRSVAGRVARRRHRRPDPGRRAPGRGGRASPTPSGSDRRSTSRVGPIGAPRSRRATEPARTAPITPSSRRSVVSAGRCVRSTSERDEREQPGGERRGDAVGDEHRREGRRPHAAVPADRPPQRRPERPAERNALADGGADVVNRHGPPDSDRFAEQPPDDVAPRPSLVHGERDQRDDGERRQTAGSRSSADPIVSRWNQMATTSTTPTAVAAEVRINARRRGSGGHTVFIDRSVHVLDRRTAVAARCVAVLDKRQRMVT